MARKRRRKRDSDILQSRVMLERIRILLTDPRILKELVDEHRSESDVKAMLNELQTWAAQKLQEGDVPPLVVAREILENLTSILVLSEVMREIVARGWNVTRAIGVKGQRWARLEIEEWDGGSISTANAIRHVLYPDWESGQVPTLDQLDTSLLTPHMLMYAVRAVVGHRFRLLDDLHDVRARLGDEATPDAMEQALRQRGYDVRISAEQAGDPDPDQKGGL